MVKLGIQERRLRRFATAYEAVYGPLPRDSREHREFTPEAVERIAAALPVLIERPALGMEEVLRRQAGGMASVSAPRAAPAAELLEVLSELRADVTALRLELAELRRELAAHADALPPASGETQDREGDITPDEPAEGPSWPSDGLGDTVRVAATLPDRPQRRSMRAGGVPRTDSVRLALSVPYLKVMQQSMKRGLGWKPERYDQVNRMLAEGDTLTAEGVNYRTAAGSIMDYRTAEALVRLRVLMPA